MNWRARQKVPLRCKVPSVTTVRATKNPVSQLAMPLQEAPGTTKTVTIIDGKTGARHEVIIPATGN